MRVTILSSFLIRFIEKDNKLTIHLQNLRTGERLEFETWAAAWVYLEQKTVVDQVKQISLRSRL